MVPASDKPLPPSILKQPKNGAGKRQRAPMIKQTVSISKFLTKPRHSELLENMMIQFV